MAAKVAFYIIKQEFSLKKIKISLFLYFLAYKKGFPPLPECLDKHQKENEKPKKRMCNVSIL